MKTEAKKWEGKSKMNDFELIEEAIKNNISFYFDEKEFSIGRTGGVRCGKCKTWIKSARKKTIHQTPTYLRDCEKCKLRDSYSRYVEYPFHVREGVIAYIKIPLDITKDEVERLSKFIETLIVDKKVANDNPA
jgi:hypothetical protein